VYPNPTKGQLIIAQNSNGLSRIELKDLSGRLIRAIQTDQLKSVVNISEFESGVYFLTVHQNGTSSTKRIVKQ